MSNEDVEMNPGLVVLFLGFAAMGWWTMYVEPRQEFMRQVAACAGNEPTLEKIESCEKQVRGK